MAIGSRAMGILGYTIETCWLVKRQLMVLQQPCIFLINRLRFKLTKKAFCFLNKKSFVNDLIFSRLSFFTCCCLFVLYGLGIA